MQDTAALKESLEQKLPTTLEMLRQMVGINSYTSNRDGVNRVGRFTAQCFAPLGFTADFVPATNPEFGDHLVLTRREPPTGCSPLGPLLDPVFPPRKEIRNSFHCRLKEI